MEPAVLGVVLDASVVIAAERRGFPVAQLIEGIQSAFGDIELSLSPVTVAELVHGIYRAKNPEASRRRREFIGELVNLVPLHPMTLRTGFNDLLIAASAIEQGYAVLTENLRHFGKILGLQVLKL